MNYKSALANMMMLEFWFGVIPTKYITMSAWWKKKKNSPNHIWCPVKLKDKIRWCQLKDKIRWHWFPQQSVDSNFGQFSNFINNGLAVRVFANGRETWVQSQVESYQRLKKWYLMPPCLTLSIIRYGSRVK